MRSFPSVPSPSSYLLCASIWLGTGHGPDSPRSITFWIGPASSRNYSPMTKTAFLCPPPILPNLKGKGTTSATTQHDPRQVSPIKRYCRYQILLTDCRSISCRRSLRLANRIDYDRFL